MDMILTIIIVLIFGGFAFLIGLYAGIGEFDPIPKKEKAKTVITDEELIERLIKAKEYENFMNYTGDEQIDPKTAIVLPKK